MLLHADSTEGAYSTSPELNITGGEGLAALCPKISPLFSASFNLAFRLFGQAAALRALQLWGGFLLVGENRRPWRFVYNIPGSNQVVVDIIDMCSTWRKTKSLWRDFISASHRIWSADASTAYCSHRVLSTIKSWTAWWPAGAQAEVRSDRLLTDSPTHNENCM